MLADLDEFGLIRLLTEGRTRTGASGGVVLGIGDDAAVVQPRPDFHTVLSCDTMVESIHFRGDTMKYGDIGYKALASNISDMAAMGAVPLYALVALSAPRSLPVERLQELYDGLYACADRYEVAVVGGDTTSSPGPLVVTVTIAGEVEQGRALFRSSARPGDIVFVTGYPGLSAAGLHYLLRRSEDAYALQGQDLPPHIKSLIREHQRPQPQPCAGRLLLQSGRCHALNDVSDGLASEAWEIAEASGCRLIIEQSRLPVHPDLGAYAAETGRPAVDWLLYGGEDYVLLGTAPAEASCELEQLFARSGGGIPFFVIGRVEAGAPKVELWQTDGSVQRIDKKGYNHFT